jgi:hypothetical protein
MHLHARVFLRSPSGLLPPIAAQRLVHLPSSAILSEEDCKLRPNPQLLAVDAWHCRYDLVVPAEERIAQFDDAQVGPSATADSEHRRIVI